MGKCLCCEDGWARFKVPDGTWRHSPPEPCPEIVCEDPPELFGRSPAMAALPDVRVFQNLAAAVPPGGWPKRQSWWIRLYRKFRPYEVPPMKHYHPTRHLHDDCH